MPNIRKLCQSGYIYIPGEFDWWAGGSPNLSPGMGTALGTYDNVTNILTLNVTFSGLLSPTIAAHFHCCAAPGVSAPVVIGFAGFPAGVTAGAYANSYDLPVFPSPKGPAY